MNNSTYITPATDVVIRDIQNHVISDIDPTPSCLNCFLVKITDIITLGFLKKSKADDYKEFTTNFTLNLLYEIQKKHIRNNSYQVPHHIELEYLNNKVVFENYGDNSDEKNSTKIFVTTRHGETACQEIRAAVFSQFCKIHLAIQRDILTEDDISFTDEGDLDLTNMDAATKSLLDYILFDADSLENTLRNDVPKHAPSSSYRHSIPLSENRHFSKLAALQRNTSFLYRQLWGKTAPDNNATNTENVSLKKAVYSPEQQYLEDITCKIVEKLKKSYNRDSTQRRSAECNGLFRTQGNKVENDAALVNLKKCSLDIDKTERDTLTYVLKKEFLKINPIDQKTFSQMKENPDKSPKILYETINTMPAQEKKRFLIMLEFYSDAYQNADDNTTSSFNKKQLLTSSLRPIILPNLYDCVKNATLSPSLINEINNYGDNIASKILTSFSYESGTVQLKTHY